MDTIYKYLLGPKSVLLLPQEAQPLTVQLQHGEPMLWVKLDPQAPTIARHFVSFATGQALETGGRLTYLATFQLDNGLVFHAFEEVTHA